MPIISLASGKGGCCKTTTALGLGLEFALGGARVALLDADPNQHAADFYAAYQKKKPALPEGASFVLTPKVTEANIFESIRKATDSADYVIIDLPGVASKLTLLGLTRSRLVIIPVQPSKMDARDGLRTAASVTEAEDTVGRSIAMRFLLSRWPVMKETIVARHTRAELTKKGLPVLRTPFMDRVQWKEMTFSGKVPRMTDPDGNAAQNMTAIANEVLEVLASTASAKVGAQA
jgi:chromosome partitioning protein